MCSSDDEMIGFEAYDAEFQIKYYSRPPYANLEQGYWYKSDTKEVFFKLTPSTEAPYQLLVCPKNDRGKEALEYMKEKEDGVIQYMYNRAYYYGTTLQTQRLTTLWPPPSTLRVQTSMFPTTISRQNVVCKRVITAELYPQSS